MGGINGGGNLMGEIFNGGKFNGREIEWGEN